MDLKIDVRPRLVQVLASGEFELKYAKRSFLEITDALEKHQRTKVLVDGREIQGNPTVVERFYYGEFVADAVYRLLQSPRYTGPPQFAYVLAYPVLDPQRMGETVAVNRGVNVKAFENVDDALEWLGSEPDAELGGA